MSQENFPARLRSLENLSVWMEPLRSSLTKRDSMMKKNLNKILFAFIVLIAFVLRFWQLGMVPPSPDWDEVALGYSAYSIMETGKDEYGKSLPVILRSFDDYKPALYAYLIIPFINIFGLTTFSVRLPGAIFGIIAVIA